MNKTFKNKYGRNFNEEDKTEIDHIIPLNKAKSKEEVLNLCYYKNMRLLLKQDNNKKGNREE